MLHISCGVLFIRFGWSFSGYRDRDDLFPIIFFNRSRASEKGSTGRTPFNRLQTNPEEYKLWRIWYSQRICLSILLNL